MTVALFTAFIIKHFICDFPLQRGYQFRNKWRYGHPGGLLHAGIHATGTLFVIAWISAPAGIIAAAADGIIHYHIDWVKSGLNHRLQLTHEQNGFWVLLGVDQMLHYLTYVVIVALTVP